MMKTYHAPPRAKRHIEGLRDIGYDFNSAIADLLDNCINADATEIRVEIRAKSDPYPVPCITVADNGKGMDRERLREAMRFSGEREYAPNDLGKYGLGLKTASLSQCNKLTVMSKAAASKGARPRKVIARWDLQHVYKKNDWELIEPEYEELEDWEKTALDQECSSERGTVVLWSGLEESFQLLFHEDPTKRTNFQMKLYREACLHLRMVFHRFMQGRASDRNKVNIYVCGDKLKPWDPFCLDTEDTKQLDPERYPIAVEGQKHQVVIRPYILPRESDWTSKEAHDDAAGPLRWNAQQGFYFYRNDRLLQAGGWAYMRVPEEHIKYLRISVDFDSELDKPFSININKMKAKIPEQIRDNLKQILPKWVDKAESSYRKGKPKSGGEPSGGNGQKPTEPYKSPSVYIGNVGFSLSNTPSKELVVVPGNKSGEVKVMVPFRHELSRLFSKGGGSIKDLKQFSIGVVGILEAVANSKMKPSEIPINTIKKNLGKYL